MGLQRRIVVLFSFGVVLFWLMSLVAWRMGGEKEFAQVSSEGLRSSILEAEELTFFVIGDWGVANSARRLEIALQMKRFAQLERPKFVVSAGDNYYYEGIQDDEESRLILDLFRDYKEMGLPWYSIVGNHDCRGNVEAQVKLSDKEPKWRMPSTYYKHEEAVQGTSVELFFLETCTLVCPTDVPREEVQKTFNEITYRECEFYSPLAWARGSMWRGFTEERLHQRRMDQLEWLRRGLAAAPKDSWKLVIGHHPILSATVTRRNNLVLERDLLPILRKGSVASYLSGHDHTLQHLKRDNIDFFVSGGGGFGEVGHPMVTTPDQKYGTSGGGFLIVKLRGRTMVSRFISNTGEELYKTITTMPK